jgi:flagellar hook assembly protein FlgD
MNVQPPPEVMQEIKKYGGDNEEVFKNLDERNSGQRDLLMTNEDLTMLIADGKGLYTASVNPGTYYVFMKSNNSSTDSKTESLGREYCKTVTVKKGETVEVSHLFDKY